MPYRVEESKNARAGCKNTECKTAGVKIQKGELRFASQVTIHEHTSWAYKHWGCVTPAQIANLIEESGGDTDMVDGYDELPADMQEKVDFALQNGHVSDEDWKGDIECNRPGQKGFRAKAPTKKKKGKDGDEDDEEVAEAPKPKAKRGRANKPDDEDEAPARKKVRAQGKKAAAKEEDDEVLSAGEVEAPKAKRGKKAAAKKEVEEEDTEEPEPPKAKRGPKAASKPKADEDDVDEELEAPKARRSKKAAASSKDKTVPQKRSGRKKAAVNYEEE